MALFLAAFVIALGFVTAGLVYTADYLFKGRIPAIVPHQPGVFGLASAFVFCMFSGPYIVLERGYWFWKSGSLSHALMATCLLISLLWSFCLGVFVAQILIGLGLLNA